MAMQYCTLNPTLDLCLFACAREFCLRPFFQKVGWGFVYFVQLESGPDPSMAAASQDVEAKAPAAGASNKSWAPSLQHTQDRSGEDAAEPPYRMAHDRAGDSASEMSSMPPMQQRLNRASTLLLPSFLKTVNWTCVVPTASRG